MIEKRILFQDHFSKYDFFEVRVRVRVRVILRGKSGFYGRS